eukprot:XP_001707298.1 Hypothetical protein GL50803_12068 [Giardia lamblia ATCC 50803]
MHETELLGRVVLLFQDIHYMVSAPYASTLDAGTEPVVILGGKIHTPLQALLLLLFCSLEAAGIPYVDA